MSDNSAQFRPAGDDVFGRIAGRYDRLCDLFSFGIHRLWKSRMADRIAREPGRHLLDLASGTGDIPLRLLRTLGESASDWQIRVSDISPEMLRIARERLNQSGSVIQIETQNAERIDAPSDSIDIVSMSFGLKIVDRSRVCPKCSACCVPAVPSCVWRLPGSSCPDCTRCIWPTWTPACR